MDLNDTGNRVIAGIIIVLVIIGAWYLGTTLKPMSGKSMDTGSAMNDDKSSSTAGSNGASSSDSTDDTMEGNGAAMNVAGEAISVADQPAGSYVMVASVTLPEMGWVAVRDASGRTLGAGRFEAGTHEAVQVPLLRNTESGQSYQVLMYADDGDRAFDLHKDAIVMNQDGTVAGASFSATSGN